MERRLREDVSAKFEISRTAARSQTDRFVVQMTISASGATLRGQESGPTLFAAVDAVTDVMAKQIRRYRAGRTERRRRAGRRAVRRCARTPTRCCMSATPRMSPTRRRMSWAGLCA